MMNDKDFKLLNSWYLRFFKSEKIISDGNRRKLLTDALNSLKRRKEKSNFLIVNINLLTAVIETINNMPNNGLNRTHYTVGLKNHYYRILQIKKLTDHYMERIKLGHTTPTVIKMYRYFTTLSTKKCDCAVCNLTS